MSLWPPWLKKCAPLGCELHSKSLPFCLHLPNLNLCSRADKRCGTGQYGRSHDGAIKLLMYRELCTVSCSVTPCLSPNLGRISFSAQTARHQHRTRL